MLAPPWQYNATLGGDFIYNPNSDEIVLRNGRRFARPAALLRTTLASASYSGPLDFQYTGSPPQSGNSYVHQGKLGQVAGSSALPIRQPGSLTAGITPTDTLRQGERPILGVNPGGTSQNRRHLPHQTIAARAETPVIFARATESQANRREDVRPPGVRERGINIGVDSLTGTLFPHFKARSSDFFSIGRVFQVLWSEPAGGASVVTRWEPGIVLNQYRERVFSKVRKFLVIRAGTNYCTALPINSYGGQGVAKRGVNKSEHVVVWSQGPNPPQPSRAEQPGRNEESMQRVPIRIDPDSPAEHLDGMARLNLAGVTTVQHNIKAKSIGKVNSRYMRALIDQFSVVWGPQQLPVPLGVAPPISLDGTASEDESEDDDDDEGEEDEDEEEAEEEAEEEDDRDDQDDDKNLDGARDCDGNLRKAQNNDDEEWTSVSIPQ